MLRKLLCLLLVTASLPTAASIAVIIDDIGYHPVQDALLTLPPAVTFSILPDAPFSGQIAELARQQQREIMLHMPMEALENRKLGPFGLTLRQSKADFKANIDAAIRSVPGVVGVNNHMGSYLTSQPKPMHEFMQIIKEKDLYFIDSRTIDNSVAEKMAQQYQIPTTHRDIFLDNDTSPAYLEQQMNKAITLAYGGEQVTIIAHPYPNTLSYLNTYLEAKMQQAGLELIKPSELIKRQSGG